MMILFLQLTNQISKHNILFFGEPPSLSCFLYILFPNQIYNINS
jgi:hypothetical protein